MILRGSCHCRALGVVLRTDADIELRACQCSFCRLHGALSVSDPLGKARIVVRQEALLTRYRFAAKTADFLLCGGCGVYIGAICSPGRATLNARTLGLEGPARPVSYESETAAERVARRLERWTPADIIDCRRMRADEPAAAALVAAYLEEIDRLFGGFDPAASVSAEPDEMAPPRGAFLVMREATTALACGGLKTHVEGIGEIKRMYTVPEARGRGLGRDLLSELEEAARDLGMHRVVLDTAASLVAATELYRSAGYQEVPAFNDNPYAARWFSKELT